MKGKTLGRIGAVVTALSMLGTMTAFADAPTIKDKENGTSYNETTNTLTVAYDGASTTGDSTFLIWNVSKIEAAFQPNYTPAAYNGTGDDILYVDQRDLKTSSSASVAFPLSAKASKDAAEPVYKIVIGMGGVGKDAALQLFELRAKPVTVTAITAPAWSQAAAQKFLINTAKDTVLNSLKNAESNALPTEVTATTDAGEKKLPLIWSAGDPVPGSDSTQTITLTAKADLSVPDGEPSLELPSMNPPATSWTFDVTLTNQIDVLTSKLNWTPEATGETQATVYKASVGITEGEVEEYLTNNRQLQILTSDGNKANSKWMKFTWATTDTFSTTETGEYTFTGTNPVLVDNANNELADGFVLSGEGLPASVTAKVSISNRATVAVTGVELVRGTYDATTGTFTDVAAVTGDLKLDDQPNNATIDEVKTLAKSTLPNGLRVTSVAAGGPDKEAWGGDVIFFINEWTVSPEWTPTPTDDVTYQLVPKADPRTLEVADDYIFAIAGLSAEDRPQATVKVLGKTEITAVQAPAATLDGGKVGDTTNPVKTYAQVIEALGENVAITAPQGVTATVPIRWECTTDGGYKQEVGSYTFVGTLGEAPAGYKFGADLVKSYTVTVTVSDAVSTPIEEFGNINNDHNSEGKPIVNGTDVRAAYQIYKGTYKFESVQGLTREQIIERANVSNDKNSSGAPIVNGTDVRQIYQYYKGTLKEFKAQTDAKGSGN